MTTHEIALPQGPQQITDKNWWSSAFIGTPLGLFISDGVYQHMRQDEEILDIRVQTQPSAWFRKLAERLKGFSEYPENWDSYGARRPQPRAIMLAVLMLEKLITEYNIPEPSVGPTSEGGIQIEWSTKGIDLELEILSNLKIGASFEDQMTGEEWDQDTCDDFEAVIRAFKILSERQ